MHTLLPTIISLLADAAHHAHHACMLLAQAGAGAPAGAPAAPPAAGAATASATKSLWQYIEGGGLIGYVIIGLSVVAVAMAIVQFVRLRTEKLAPPAIVEAIERGMHNNDTKGVMQFCNQPENDVFLCRVVGQALSRCSRSPFGMLELRSALEEAGAGEATRLSRPNEVIALIASIAPMLGLLGTVVGMVGAFDTIAGTQGAAKPADLAGYISIALITTVQGLVVAIPCTAAHSYFRSRMEKCAGEVAAIAEGLAAEAEQRTEKQAPRAAPAMPRAAAPQTAVPATPAATTPR
jgi:biopolymer transport protein ExbB